jgi:hypothetical protein
MVLGTTAVRQMKRVGYRYLSAVAHINYTPKEYIKRHPFKTLSTVDIDYISSIVDTLHKDDVAPYNQVTKKYSVKHTHC